MSHAHDADAPEEEGLATVPLLGMLAAVAALTDLLLNRVAILSLSGTLPDPLLRDLSDWGELPRNLAAVCGLVAITVALVAFLRTTRYAPIRRRLAIAGFAGIFLPTMALATFLPEERIKMQIIVVGTGAANVLAVLIALTAARRPAPPGIRIGVVLAAAACLLAFLALVLGVVRPIAQTRIAVVSALVFRRTGEVAFLLAPISVAASVLPTTRDLRSRLALVTGAVVFLGVAGAIVWGRSILRADFDIILYAAQRVELLLDGFPLAYALPLGVCLGAAAGAMVSREPAHRQAGAGLLLLVAAGYAPRSPGRLLMMVLGVTLLARASIALGEAMRTARAGEAGREGDRDAAEAETEADLDDGAGAATGERTAEGGEDTEGTDSTVGERAEAE